MKKNSQVLIRLQNVSFKQFWLTTSTKHYNWIWSISHTNPPSSGSSLESRSMPATQHYLWVIQIQTESTGLLCGSTDLLDTDLRRAHTQRVHKRHFVHLFWHFGGDILEYWVNGQSFTYNNVFFRVERAVCDLPYIPYFVVFFFRLASL